MPSTRWESILATVLVAYWVAIGVVAQQISFKWGFNDWTSTTLPQCQPLAIFVDESGGIVKPVPPYYLAAFEAEGLSTVNYVGNKVGNLTWTVNHLTGARLVLTMFDSVGNSGGVLNDIYTIAGEGTGTNASCISKSTPAITVKSNTTSQINTCDTIRLSISGGKQPYSVSIAETNSQSPLNFTMGPNDNIYSWVNDLSPGNDVILSVFDSNGNYGLSTGIITLSGSSNTHCPTSSTSSSNSTTGSNNNGSGGSNNNQNGSAKSSTNTAAIAGAVIAVFFISFFGLLAWFFIRKRKQKRNEVRESRRGWSIDRNDSIKVNGGRTRIPSDPHESDVAPFRMPTGSLSSSASINGYAETQATPFILESERPASYLPGSSRGTFYRDGVESEVDEEDAYALDAFRLSGVGSNSGSQAPGSVQRDGVLSRGLRVVNEDVQDRGMLSETKRSMAQSSGVQQQRPVFQHQDAGSAPVEEIPPAYPGPSVSGGL